MPDGRKPKARRKPAPLPVFPSAKWKVWAFRVAAVFLVPGLCLGVLELALRLIGYGYPTAFLLPNETAGKKLLVQNNQFGWRFFGAQMARSPAPIALPPTKPPHTIRIFVFGESAAYGDPQPRFGLPRMLESVLSLRHPGTRFEVINAAMTAINSHVILPIARDCGRADGDIWVLYMGNNEVVGPFGAGTVFGPPTPPLAVIRANLALRATRTGQALEDLSRHFSRRASDENEWGGMMMFLGHQVSGEDAHLQTVYHHFAQNVADILAAGRSRDAGIVVSTVAVNLLDCAPFASSHRADLSEADRAKWDELYQSGIQAQNVGDLQTALVRFQEAFKIDATFAELCFRLGSVELGLGQSAEAQKRMVAARDLDTLRFRCDTRLNELLRNATVGREAQRILLADSERAFSKQTPQGLPGNEFFYEHVHLTFEGNYLLALTIAKQTDKLLPENLAKGITAEQPWPTAADCARRLAWTDWSKQAAYAEMFGRLQDPPFTAQLNHAAQMEQLAGRLQQLAPALQPAGLAEAEQRCNDALKLEPDDPWVLGQMAVLKRAAGDWAGAETAARKEVQLLPSSDEAWERLGFVQAQQHHYEDALKGFTRAFELDPENVWALQNLAQTLVKLERRDEAEQEYRRALQLKPRFGMAWLGLGQVLQAKGQNAEAEACYLRALTNRIHRAGELTTLARFCQSRGWHEAAATNFLDAIKLNPADPTLRLEAGQSLAASGHHPEAMAEYADAVRLAPDLAQARFLHGLELGRQGKPAEAADEFRAAVKLMPDLLEARLNFGIALVNLGQRDEALAQFDEVLRRSPTNGMALRYKQELQSH
jgi:tetratricopeptide (TPR) repeat protein